MFKILKTVFLLLLIFIWNGIAWANSQQNKNADYYFKQISIEQGLSRSTIHSILCSSQGIIWVGTPWGLNRIDRDELKIYLHESENSYSLPGNLIYFIAEDSQNRIWVSTDHGMVSYDAGQDRFLPVSLKENIYSYCLVQDGILFGANSCLYFYSYSNQQFTKQPIASVDSDQQTPFVYILQQQDNSFLLVSKERGIWKYNSQTGNMIRYTLPESSTEDITMAKQDSRGNLYLSSFQQGLYCFDQAGGQLFHLTTTNSGLTNDIILDMVDHNGQLWLATDGGGIVILDTVTMNIRVLRHIPGDASSLPVNSISCLHVDSENNLWAGSVRGGMFGIKEVYIRTYKDITLNSIYGLSDKAVISLYEEPSGILWIGTDGGGLNRFDPANKTFRHYPSTFDEKVISVTGFTRDELLISLFSKRMYLFNKRTGSYRPFTIIDPATDHSECASGFLALAYQITPNKICILARNIYLYEISSGRFSQVQTTADPHLLSAQQLVWSNDSVTYLTKGNRIFEFCHQDMLLKEFFALEKNDKITAVVRDSSGYFWIGSNQGLSCYDSEKKQFKQIYTRLFNNILALSQDRSNRLWIGAHNMLFSYLKDENRFMVWSESDGFLPNELLFLPSLQPPINNLYMGGAGGLIEIDQAIESREDETPKLFLREVLVNGAAVPLDLQKPFLSIPWNYTSCVIKVDLNDKDLFREVLFHHQIRGENNSAIEKYSNTLYLSALSPGSYRISSSCNMKNGTWTTPVELLNITVLPPWYKNSFIIFLLLFIFMTIFISVIYMIIRKKENKLKWQMQERERQNDEDKIRFLLNISHELRTPLTLICAPLKRMLNQESLSSDKLKEQLKGLYKQAVNMKNIISLTLDVNKISEGLYELQKKTYRINDWVKEIGDEFSHEFAEKNCLLEYVLDPKSGDLSFDNEKCRIVLSNLLVNALKFSDPGDKTVLSTCLLANSVRISVADQGIGLGDIEPQRLFSRFYQGNHDRGGSGIGLTYAKMLVEIHGGKIGAQNNTQGATFYFELPIDYSSEKQAVTPQVDFNSLFTDTPECDQNTEIFDLSDYHLLIVEDKTELRSFLKEELKNSFKYVYTAADGRDAWEIIRNKIPDIVVSDLMMPQMNGYELCRNIKNDQETAHIQVVLLTAVSNEEQIKQGYNLGADSYVTKPFEIDFLLTIMRKLLRNREMLRSRYKNFISREFNQEIPINNADEKFMLTLNGFIANNLSCTDLDVSSIIEKMSMSRAVLYKKVKELTGMGIKDYINKFRIERAETLLRESDLSITEISELVGFSYQRYFSAVFKQSKGMLPSAYRQQQQTKEK